MVRIDDASPATTFEYVECTAISGTTLTVTRGQEGTTGIAHNAGAFVGNDLTAAMLGRVAAQGMLPGGYASVAVDQGAITTLVDLTGLTVTVTLFAGRRYRISTFLSASNATAAGSVQVFIVDTTGPVNLVRGETVSSAAGSITSISPSAIVSPGAGAKTYKLQATGTGGTGSLRATIALNCYIMIEDIGQA